MVELWGWLSPAELGKLRTAYSTFKVKHNLFSHFISGKQKCQNRTISKFARVLKYTKGDFKSRKGKKKSGETCIYRRFALSLSQVFWFPSFFSFAEHKRR